MGWTQGQNKNKNIQQTTNSEKQNKTKLEKENKSESMEECWLLAFPSWLFQHSGLKEKELH